MLVYQRVSPQQTTHMEITVTCPWQGKCRILRTAMQIFSQHNMRPGHEVSVWLPSTWAQSTMLVQCGVPNHEAICFFCTHFLWYGSARSTLLYIIYIYYYMICSFDKMSGCVAYSWWIPSPKKMIATPRDPKSWIDLRLNQVFKYQAPVNLIDMENPSKQ